MVDLVLVYLVEKLVPRAGVNFYIGTAAVDYQLFKNFKHALAVAAYRIIRTSAEQYRQVLRYLIRPFLGGNAV